MALASVSGMTPACASARAKAASNCSRLSIYSWSEKMWSIASLRNSLSKSLIAAIFSRSGGHAKRKAPPSKHTSPRGQMDQLYALEHRGDALAHTDAHRAQRIAALGPLQLIKRGRDQSRPACAQRMPDRDCSAVRVYSRGVIGHAQLAQHGQRLGSER